MAKYQVTIHGQNFLINVGGRAAKHGFYTWRFVEAADALAAEYAAVEMIRQQQDLREAVNNDPADPPIMNVDEIVELESFAGIECLKPGFVWYEHNPKRWWQFWRS